MTCKFCDKPVHRFNRCREHYNEYMREYMYKYRHGVRRGSRDKWLDKLGVGSKCSGDCLNCELPDCILPVDHLADERVEAVLYG
jgi:hypothetical protein